MTQSSLFTSFKGLDTTFSEAVDKFQDNKQFAYVCSLLILNSNNLIVDPQSKLLFKHFNYESDLVTILESLYEISEKETANSDDSGFNCFTISFIYSQIEKVFEVTSGREAVHQSIEFSKNKEEGIFGEIEKFIKCFNQKEFIDKRKFEFKHVCNASPEKVPSLIYKTKDDKEINIYKRPGSQGLQSPGNIIVLSLNEDSMNNESYGMIIHKDKTENDENLGVVSIEIFNNLFFFKIFENYIDDLFTKENFVNIYKTKITDDNISINVFIDNFYEKSYLSYCPRNKAVDEKVRSSISFINSLIPFVPRSILVRDDLIKCSIEIVGYGSCQNYLSFIHLDSKKTTHPIAYPINKTTLGFVLSNIEELKKDRPKVRFAITGENFIYKNSNEDENESISYPNVFPSIKNVFDSNHPSHLILLVDNDYENKVDVQPLSLIPIEEPKEKRQIAQLKWNYDETSIPIINNTSYYDENSTCAYICNSNESLLQPLFAYEKDGSTKPLKVCKECFLEIFKSSEEFQYLFDPVTKKIDYEKLNKFDQFIPGLAFIDEHTDDDNTSWPQIPLGQILFTLINDEELNLYSKAWFTIVVKNSIELSIELTRCPNHPNKFYEKPKKGISIKCENCDMMFCSDCQLWHSMQEECISDNANIKRCPYCKAPCVKIAGANNIACRCGKYWCYKCSPNSPIFNTAAECYLHMSEEHGGYYT